MAFSSWGTVAESLPPVLPGWVVVAIVVVLLAAMGLVWWAWSDRNVRLGAVGGVLGVVAAAALVTNTTMGRHVDEQAVLERLDRWMQTDQGERLTPLPAEGIEVKRGSRRVEFTAVDAKGDPRRYVLEFPEPVDTTGVDVDVDDSPTLQLAGGLF